LRYYLKDMETNQLETLAAEIAAKTGAPIEAARVYLKAFLRSPEARTAVIAAAKAVRS